MMSNWNNIIGDIISKVIFAILCTIGTGVLIWFKWLRKKVYVKSIYDWNISVHGSNDLGVAYIISQWNQGDYIYEYKIDFKNSTDDEVVINNIKTIFRKGKEIIISNEEDIEQIELPANKNKVKTISYGITGNNTKKVFNVDNVVFQGIIAGTKKRISHVIAENIKMPICL